VNPLRNLVRRLGLKLAVALTPDCRAAVRWISRARETRLSPWQRLRLRLHQRICRACARYDRQLVVLKQAVRPAPPGVPVAPRLSAEFRQRLKRRLRELHAQPLGRPRDV
jgi:hypothetical protein